VNFSPAVVQAVDEHPDFIGVGLAVLLLGLLDVVGHPVVAGGMANWYGYIERLRREPE
jgi:hypothetical protein